jgi:hypothetical protein
MADGHHRVSVPRVRLTLTHHDLNTIMAGLDSERELCREDPQSTQWEYDRLDLVEAKIQAARKRMKR